MEPGFNPGAVLLWGGLASVLGTRGVRENVLVRVGGHSCPCVTDGECPMLSVIPCLVSHARGCHGHCVSQGDAVPVTLCFSMSLGHGHVTLSCLCDICVGVYPCLMTPSG